MAGYFIAIIVYAVYLIASFALLIISPVRLKYSILQSNSNNNDLITVVVSCETDCAWEIAGLSAPDLIQILQSIIHDVDVGGWSIYIHLGVHAEWLFAL